MLADRPNQLLQVQLHLTHKQRHLKNQNKPLVFFCCRLTFGIVQKHHFFLNGQTILPRATTAMTARNGGPANHWPQQSFPGRSDGDLLKKMSRINNEHTENDEFKLLNKHLYKYYGNRFRNSFMLKYHIFDMVEAKKKMFPYTLLHQFRLKS